MKTVKVHDKTFKTFILHEEVVAQVRRIAEQLNEDLKDTKPVFVCILNGSFMFAADLLKHIELPCEVSFVKMASYHGTNSGDVKELIGFNESLKNRHVVVIEDIVDTGKTLQTIVEKLTELGVASLKVAALLLKPGVYKKEYKVDYVGLEIPNDFIVGYGLDYDGLGRNLRDIYVYTEE